MMYFYYTFKIIVPCHAPICHMINSENIYAPDYKMICVHFYKFNRITVKLRLQTKSASNLAWLSKATVTST